jgi:hypothetical protein
MNENPKKCVSIEVLQGFLNKKYEEVMGKVKLFENLLYVENNMIGSTKKSISNATKRVEETRNDLFITLKLINELEDFIKKQ